jgi:hypothetical protein
MERLITQDGKACTRFVCHRLTQITGTYERCCEPSDTIKRGQFRDKLRNYQLVKKCSAPWSWVSHKLRFLSFYI